MTVGFVMLAHEALHRATQVARTISQAGCPLIVHVDKRTSDTAFHQFARSVSDLETVSLAPRIACDWGTWSLVQASRDAVESQLANYPDVTHVALISGACLPIKPLRDLKRHLEQNPDCDFIESVTIEDVPWTQGGLSDERFEFSFPFAWKRQKRLFDTWVELQRLVRRKRAMPAGLVPHMGSQWWCLTRHTLEAILNDPNRPMLDRYFRRVWIPDESYFQSLVRYYGRKVVSRSLTLSKFDYQGKPHVLYDDHLPMLRQNPAFFARKIWPGANRLYRAFLEAAPPNSLPSAASASQIDRTFSQAIAQRTQGRRGLVMASRFPKDDIEGPLTAAPYAVFYGFTDVFNDFPTWVQGTTRGRVHGHLFDPDRVQFHGNQSGFAGGMSDYAALRDYDPEAFLRNLIWNTRGEHQSFMLGAQDSPGIHSVLARDRNATLAVITGAWALPLLRSGKPVAEVRKSAAELQKIETKFLSQLRERRTRARILVWSLLDFLDNPADAFQEIVDVLSGTESQLITELPQSKPLRGLPDFLQALRNAGMNPHLAGELRPASHPSESEEVSQRPSV